MNKVVAMLDENVHVFEDVTRVKIDFSSDIFGNKVYIYQGKKLTKIKEYQLIEIDIK